MKTLKQIENDISVSHVERVTDNGEKFYLLWLADGFHFNDGSHVNRANSVKELNELLSDVEMDEAVILERVNKPEQPNVKRRNPGGEKSQPTANNLKSIREDKKISQSKLAELSGVSVRMIQHYEQGVKDINKAQVDTVYKLAQALGVTVENLINK
jgi:DNA-binding transcriptional regulator YiaG